MVSRNTFNLDYILQHNLIYKNIMNFKNRTYFPLVTNDGVTVYNISQFCIANSETITCRKTNTEYDLLTELKKSCLTGPSGVLTAFSNTQVFVQRVLEVGKIVSIEIPCSSSEEKLVIIGAPKYVAIPGDAIKGECVFPWLQYHGDRKINISCAAFESCPNEYKPIYYGDIYLAYETDNLAIKILQKSLWEFSQNNPNLAIILLFASVEIATEYLTGEESGKIVSRLNSFRKKDEQKILSCGLIDRVEKHIVKVRGRLAHKGEALIQNDLLKSYETALEFFWRCLF